MRYYTIMSVVAGAVIMSLSVACGGQKEHTTVITVVDTPQSEAEEVVETSVPRTDRESARKAADRLALNADDLTADQGVSVLLGFYDMHREYSAENKYKSDMETMRKFVDVYDIVNSNHGQEFKKALKSTRQVYPDVDFTEVYREFVDKLSQYDGYELSDRVQPVRTDTDSFAAKPVVSGELPPELRPAH